MVGHFSHNLSGGSGLNKSIRTHLRKSLKKVKKSSWGEGVILHKKYKNKYYRITNIAYTLLAYE